ncbi:glycosyltransferase family 4 protein [Candidatus Saccharibacteria bacterium]|nr:glycosyltransferase family 4 protein [Candidatus Saccharibacteria bacterium]
MSKKVFLIRGISPDAYGGAEKYQITLGSELLKNGYEPIIVTPSKKLLEEATEAGIKTIKSPFNKQQNWSGYRNLFLPAFVIWEIYLYFWYLFKVLKYRPKVLHVQSRDEFIAATLVGKNTKTKVVWTDHSDLRLVVWENIDKKFKNPIGKYIFKLAKYPAKITTISNYEYDFVSKIIPKQLSNFVVVPNGAFDCLKQYPAKKHHNVVGFLGRIIDYKGVKELILAFDKVSKKHQDAKLIIYGTGDNDDYYKKLSGNKAIKFMGYTSEPLKAYAEMGIFVLPSYHEGLSLALLDAAMMQKAMVATDIDGNPEIVIDKKTGLLVKAQDVDSLADALDKLLSSPSLQDKYAANARKLFLEKYDFPTIVREKIVPIYEE